MAAALYMVFNTGEDDKTKTLIIKDPKDDLKKADVAAVGATIETSKVFNTEGKVLTYKEAYYHENVKTVLAEA